MGLFLTQLELQELTGYKLSYYQVGWLKAQGYYVETNARGIPKITYSQVENHRRIQSPADSAKSIPSINNSQPNLQKLHNKIGINNG